jgi:hypothetical protein
MKIELVLDDWKDQTHKSIYNTPAGVELMLTDFHSGTTFKAEIHLDKAQEAEFRAALSKGFRPVFWVTTGK